MQYSINIFPHKRFHCNAATYQQSGDDGIFDLTKAFMTSYQITDKAGIKFILIDTGLYTLFYINL